MSEKFDKNISIASDIHDPEKISGVVEEMREVGADINLSIGDAFDSVLKNDILRGYKENPQKATEELNDEERKEYDKLVGEGNPPIRAYWLSKIRCNPELLGDIKLELDRAYQIFAEAFSSLPSVGWLSGNLETGYANTSEFSEAKMFDQSLDEIERINIPKVLYEDDEVLGVVFPSLDKRELSRQTVLDFLSGLTARIKEKKDLKSVFVVAHEYLFKGRPVEKFKEKMIEAGITNYQVPFYLPNNYRKELLDFIFKIPEGVDIKFIYGHIHDPKEVTQAGIAFEDSADGLGMKWGVSKKDEGALTRRTRHFDMYQLPLQSVYQIGIKDGQVIINKK
jgi:hypothetical protein